MLIADDLYGPFELPDQLRAVILAPEVQRLRDVRLVNAPALSIGILSDLKRLTHALGVVHLVERIKNGLRERFDQDDILALQVAALIHDAMTPAFAHLFEYLLSAQSGFSHEQRIESLLSGSYRPENEAHQIFHGGQLRLRRVLDSMKLDPAKVVEIVRGQGPLGQFVNGTALDLDNIDNVFRMAQLLGLGNHREIAVALGQSLQLAGDRLLPNSRAGGLVRSWLDTRRRCYEILAFDPEILAAQTMLTQCFEYCLAERLLSEEYWHLTDSQMLSKLESIPQTAPIVRRLTLGDTYDMLTQSYCSWSERGVSIARAPQERRQLEDAISKVAGGIGIHLFIAVDDGMISRSVDVLKESSHDPSEVLTMGTRSRGLIVSVFTERHSVRLTAEQRRKIDDALVASSFTRSSTYVPPGKEEVYGIGRQTALPV